MANTGSNLGKNPFLRAMQSSIGNACEISSKVEQALDAQSSSDTRIADEKTYFETYDDTLQQAGIDYNASFDTRIGVSKNLRTFENTIPAEVKAWWRLLTDVYDVGTPTFNNLWGHGNTWFYNHSRTTNLLHMNALVTNIGTDTALAAFKTRVQGFINNYQSLIDKQTGEKTEVSTDSSSFASAVNASATALFVVYCGLVRIFPDDLSKVISFFPMQLIYRASKMRQYRKLIPAASRKKMCSRAWKNTDKITLQNNLTVALSVGLASDKEGEVASWYLLAAGVTVTVSPADLGNTSLKALIVQNNDITTKGDISVTILQA